MSFPSTTSRTVLVYFGIHLVYEKAVYKYLHGYIMVHFQIATTSANKKIAKLATYTIGDTD